MRAFLGSSRGGDAAMESPDESPVRAFLITNGRTSSAVELAFESMLSAKSGPFPQLTFERAAIFELCSTGAQSLAELAARLRIPLGTARVLAADLIGEEVLEVHQPMVNPSADVALLRRLIHGVRAL